MSNSVAYMRHVPRCLALALSVLLWAPAWAAHDDMVLPKVDYTATAIHEVSVRPPSADAMVGVAVASSVWSTAARNIGKKTAMKRFKTSARDTFSVAAIGVALVAFKMMGSSRSWRSDY